MLSAASGVRPLRTPGLRWLVLLVAVAVASPVSGEDETASGIRTFVSTFCQDCHSGEEAEAGLDLTGETTMEAVRGSRDRWEKILGLVRVGNMPPADADQPPKEQREQFLERLDHALFYVDCSQEPESGRVTIRRLNRVEYNNTIRQLVGVDFRPADSFPSDDVGYGFDHIGDVLTLSPLLMEKYLDAAEEIAARAIIAPEDARVSLQVRAEQFASEGAVDDGPYDSKIFTSRGTVHGTFELPHAGKYVIRIEAAADQAGDEPARMEVSLDKTSLETVEIKGHQTPGWYELHAETTAGSHRLSVAFVNDFYDPELKKRPDRNLYVRVLELSGPADVRPESLPESHRTLVESVPGKKEGGRKLGVTDAAIANLRPFLARAFRRPVSGAEVALYARFVRLAVERGESFERGMQVAVTAALVSPEFLFRAESDPRYDDDDDDREERYEPHDLEQYELATRLSYFLWSTMPDDELFEQARKKRLTPDGSLRTQTRRMLADPRSRQLTENFAGQWLGLRRLHTTEIMPDVTVFPMFTPELRTDIEQETLAFVDHIIRTDASILDLLDGRYTFVNARLAELYGIPGITGDELRRVDLTDGRRSGVLTQASILTLTSYPGRTSPVKRGEWVLSNILGDEPPPPPAAVPGLDVTRQAHPGLPLRKQLEIHRQDPGCASCHRVMDDIGFGFENFDAIGRWRDSDQGHPIDAAGELPSGESFATPAELIAILRAREQEFARCFVEKLLTYALGRGLEYYDRCTIDEILEKIDDQDYRFSAVVDAIVTSRPFLMRRRERRSDDN
jgi:hypothetical protein